MLPVRVLKDTQIFGLSFFCFNKRCISCFATDANCNSWKFFLLNNNYSINYRCHSYFARLSGSAWIFPLHATQCPMTVNICRFMISFLTTLIKIFNGPLICQRLALIIIVLNPILFSDNNYGVTNSWYSTSKSMILFCKYLELRSSIKWYVCNSICFVVAI